MKLLYVTDNGFCNKNGTYYHSAPNIAHMNNLSAFFDQFVVVAREDECANGYQPIKENTEVHLVPKNNVLMLNRIIKECVKECDAVICYGNNGYFASRIGKRNKKVVISYNGGDPYDFLISRGTFKGRILAPIARYMCKQSFKNSSFGHYCDDFLFERYPASGEMLACSGVDVVCDPEVLDSRLKKIEGFSKNQNKIRLGLIGHTKNSLKGIDIAIKALSKLDDNFCLDVVGRGDYEQYIDLAKSLNCDDRINFLGALAPGNELFSWIDSLDIYIQPSRIEGLPRATIEAMSRACPAVVSDAGALRKLIDGEYVTRVEDINQLEQYIRKITSNGNMENQAIRNFEKAKNYERVVRDRKYKDFYLKVVREIERRNKN